MDDQMNSPVTKEQRDAAMQRLLDAYSQKQADLTMQPQPVAAPAPMTPKPMPMLQPMPEDLMPGDEPMVNPMAQPPALPSPPPVPEEAPAQANPFTLRKPFDLEKINSGYGNDLSDKAIQDAQKEAKWRQFGVDLNRIIATAGGKDADNAITRSLQEQVNQPLKDIETRRKGKEGEQAFKQNSIKIEDMVEDERLKSDPNSIVSKMYRDLANKVVPGLPQEATAKDLESIMPFLKSQVAKQAKGLRFERIMGADGAVKVVAIDPATGEVVKEVGNAGFAQQLRTDPFGNIIGANPGNLNEGPRTVVSSKRQALPTDEEAKQEVVEAFRPDKEQVKGIANERKFAQNVNKNMKERLEAANTLESLLASPSKLTQGSAAFQLARLSGSNSQLSDAEREVFANLPDIASKAKVLIDQKLRGKMNPELLSEYRKLVKEYSTAAKKTMDSRLKQSYNTLEQNYSVPKEFVQNQFEDDPRVRVQLDNGKIGSVPSSKLEAFLKAHPTAKQVK